MCLEVASVPSNDNNKLIVIEKNGLTFSWSFKVICKCHVWERCSNERRHVCIMTYTDTVELRRYPCDNLGLPDVCRNVGG